MRVQVELLENEADFGSEQCHVCAGIGNIHPVNQYVTFLDGFQAIDTSDEGGFSRTGRAANDDNFALCYVKIDIVEDMKIPVPLIYVFERNHGTLPKD
tara:strand:- start:121 stop:414 length:294 start_codon:yes stop_codon:yes gene_type:complete